MISLKIEPEEFNIIQEEGISGIWSKKFDFNGGGFGLYIIKNLMQLNKGEVILKSNVIPEKAFLHQGLIPYENNQVILKFQKGNDTCD